MTTARFLVGDVFDRMAELEDGSVDLVMTSPPFLALRSYLPESHPDKHKEIGSEATPAEFLDTLLALTAEWGRLLAPHGSICVELGDTYAGSGGAGGDYGAGGLRDGQERFNGSARAGRLAEYKDQRGNPAGMRDTTFSGANTRTGGGTGWPLDKSLCGIPTLYAWSLAYGRNLLTGQPSPAGQWRVRNLVAWVRPNPPVGALGDKFRPATSYLTIATRARDRYFDLDAVRTAPQGNPRSSRQSLNRGEPGYHTGGDEAMVQWNPAGAPPLDWWNHVDQLIDDELQQDHGGPSTAVKGGRYMPSKQKGLNEDRGDKGAGDFGATRGLRGSHIRRRLEQAGYLGGPTDDVWDIAPTGYPGAHYAVYPPELCVRPILAMCPARVCTTCGQPSRRLTEASYEQTQATNNPTSRGTTDGVNGCGADPTYVHGRARKLVETVGWSDCGHGSYRCRSCHVLVPSDYAVRRPSQAARGEAQVGGEAVLVESVEGTGRQAEVPGDVRGVRDRLPGEDAEWPGLQPELLSEAGAPRGPDAHDPTEEPRPDTPPDDQRVRAAVGAGGHARAAEERPDDGTPAGHAGAPRPSTAAVGDRSPSQRGEGRQPAREPRDRDEGAARRDGDLPSLPGDVRGQLTDGYVCPCGSTDIEYVADHWRPGHVLDPFGGSGTTAAVATGHGRACTLIDIDPRNADLARDRIGMFLEVHEAVS